jgi:hypothetical protein
MSKYNIPKLEENLFGGDCCSFLQNEEKLLKAILRMAAIRVDR